MDAASALASLRPGAAGPADGSSTAAHRPATSSTDDGDDNISSDDSEGDDDDDDDDDGTTRTTELLSPSASAAGGRATHPLPGPRPPTTTAHALDAKKPRACEACRGLKVRCDMPEPTTAAAAAATLPCRRCAKAGRRCVVTQPTRRRQKKTDSRVAELEKKIDALTASLQLARPSGGGSGGANGIGMLLRDDGDAWLVSAAAATSVPHHSRSPYSAGSSSAGAGQKRKFAEVRDVSAAAVSDGGPASRPGSVVVDEPSEPRAGLDRPAKRVAPTSAAAAVLSGSPGSPAPPLPPPPAGPASPPGAFSADVRFGAGYIDVIDRGLLSKGQAAELFRRYNDQMIRHMPAVVFAPGTTAADVRAAKPILFLSILAAASTEMADVQRVLVRELMHIFAEKVFVVGEKSLELVQAMQIAVIWYWPPENFEELKFYQIVHNAAVMAIDLGLGKRRSCAAMSAGLGAGLGAGGGMGPRVASQGPLPPRLFPPGGGVPFANWRDQPFKRLQLPDPCTLESRRAWLSCYFVTSSAAMALHRPNLVRWTPFMSECVEVLENSPDAAPTDQYLCYLVWTHRLAEEVGLQFCMDDPTAVVSLADPRIQYALRGFEREVDRRKATIPRDMMQATLRLGFDVLSLYMHEIALQTESGDDGRPPAAAAYASAAGSTREALTGGATLTPAHIRALTACLMAIDGIFDAFLGMDVAALRCLPVFQFVRVTYATVVLVKLYLFASSPNSELGQVIDKDHMRVEQHLNALLEKFRATAAGNRSRPAGKFLFVIAMIRSWFLKQARQPSPLPAAGAGKTLPETTAKQQRSSALPSDGSWPTAAAGATPSPTPTAAAPSQPPGVYASANTPLQLLSELAANDYTAASTAALAQQEQVGGAPSAYGAAVPPWTPPFYSSLRGSASGQSGRPHPPPPPPPQPPAPAPAQPLMAPPSTTTTTTLTTADYMALYPGLSLGGNFGEAMDLTLMGLSGAVPAGAPNGLGLSDGIQSFSSDPWFVGASGDPFPF